MLPSIPHTQPGQWPDLRQGGIADQLGAGCHASGEQRPPAGAASPPIALIGLPDDTGVSLNNGRPGAAAGPTAFRAALARFGNPFDAKTAEPITTRFVDCGDIVCSAASDPVARVHENHDRASGAVEMLHEAGFVTIGIGGGHDGTFAFARGLGRHLQKRGGDSRIAGVNLDPHLDVRETVGSGMPFRELIEQGFLDPACFVELGTGRFSNSREHVEYLTSRGSHPVPIDALLGEPNRAVDRAFEVAFGSDRVGFVTIDLDALDGSYAPGVSAVNPMGVSPAIAAFVAERAGETPGVRHFDIMELCPAQDDGRTARIAALLFIHFLAGFERRSGS